MGEVCFVGRGIPNLIKSAGDIRALRMLKILRKAHNVTVIARSADFGESDVKGIGCSSYLSGNSQTTLSTLFVCKKFDIIILSHWTVGEELIDFIRQNSEAKIWIDTIDVEFLRLSRKFLYDSSKISELEVDRVRGLELGVYGKADGLIVASKQDEEELLKFGKFRIIELPCMYFINNEYRVNSGKNAYIICNWKHEPNIVSTQYLCEKIVPFTELLFYIVGKHPPESIKSYASNTINVMGAEYEINKFLLKMNVLLCPVFWGAGMNGKIGESLAFGIPVVTSSLGALPYGLVHGETAMISDNDESFVECIKNILFDDKLRSKLSVQGREMMQSYTVDYWQERFLSKVL